MKVSVHSPTHEGATIASLYLAHHLSTDGHDVGIVMEDEDEAVTYGGFPERINSGESEITIVDHYDESADVFVVVTDASYRPLRRLITRQQKVDYVLVIDHSERALSIIDVMKSLGVKTENVFSYKYDPRIQRACDAGLLTSRFIRDAGGLWDATSAVIRSIKPVS
jgi:hypothetical protein